MRILKNIGIFLAVLILAFLLANPLGKFLFPLGYTISFASFIVPEYWYYFFDGIIFSYTFFLFLLFTAFGGKGKYWWMGIAILPALAFELYFDLPHIYFPIALGIVGWVIGFGVQKITGKFLN